MKLASYLKQSRHGIFYYRIQFKENGRWRELNASLGTRDPLEAKALAYTLTARIKPFLTPSQGKAMALNPKDLDPKSIREMVLKGLKIGPMTIDHLETSDDPAIAKQELDALAKLAQSIPVPESDQERARRERFEKEKAEIAGLLQEERLTVREAITKFMTLEKGGLAPSTQSSYQARLDMLAGFVGETRQINSITARDLNDAHDALILTAPHDSKRNTKTAGRLNPTTVKDFIILWKSFFAYLKRKGLYKHDNPAADLKPQAKSNDEAERGAEAFDDNELETIFKLENFTALNRPHKFFVPFLALLTGARANELACLQLSNFVTKDGVLCIQFTNDAEAGQRLKNAASKRIIPVHPALLQIGLQDYIDDLKTIGATRLFPYLPLDKNGKRERYISRDINDFLKDVGVYKYRAKVLHSFRDTLITRLSYNDVKAAFIHDFVGHSRKGIQDQHYLPTATPAGKLQEAVIQKMDFDILFSQFRYKADSWTGWIKQNMVD